MFLNFLSKKRFGVLVAFVVALAQEVPQLASAQGDVFSGVRDIVSQIIWGSYLLIIPFIILGMATGFVQVAGPWNLRVVRKAGRMNIEMGFITLFIFLITPALLGIIKTIGDALGGSWCESLPPGTPGCP